MATTAYRCNDIECERVDRHWPIFDQESGSQTDDATTVEEAHKKSDTVADHDPRDCRVCSEKYGTVYSGQSETMLVAIKPEPEVEGDMHVYFGNEGVTDGLPVWFYSMDLTNADALAIAEALLQELLRTGHPKVARLRSGPGYVMTV